MRLPRAVVEDALAAGQRWLDPLSVHRLLTAYGIPGAAGVGARPRRGGRTGARFAGGNAVVVKLAPPTSPTSPTWTACV
jgi:acetyltransferase